MQKNTLAMDVIRTANNHARFWFMAFILTLTAAVVKHFVERR